MSLRTCREKTLQVPCHVGDPDLWFAESPVDLERAKALCADCPIRRECLAAALQRLYEDRAHRETLEAAAYRNATRPEFSWSAISSRWQRLFDQMLAE